MKSHIYILIDVDCIVLCIFQNRLLRRGGGGDDPQNNPPPPPPPENDDPNLENIPDPNNSDNDEKILLAKKVEDLEKQIEMQTLERKQMDLEKKQRSLELMRQLDFEMEKKENLEKQISDLRQIVHDKLYKHETQVKQVGMQHDLSARGYTTTSRSASRYLDDYDGKMQHDLSTRRHTSTSRYQDDYDGAHMKKMQANAELLGIKQEDLLNRNVKQEYFEDDDDGVYY